MSPAEFSRPRITGVGNESLALERFDYSRIGAHWAVIRLVARLSEDIGLPVAPRLVVEHRAFDFPARACVTERRLRHGEIGVTSLLWRGALAVPVRVAEHPGAAFALHAGDELLMALPAPVLRTITPRSLRVQPPAPARATPRATRHRAARIASVATVAALTSASSPVAALASTLNRGSVTTAPAAPSSPTSVATPPLAPAATSATTPSTATTTVTAPSATSSTTTPTATASTTSSTSTTSTTSTPVVATTSPTSTVPPAASPATATNTPIPAATSTTTATAATAGAERISAAQRAAASARSAQSARSAAAQRSASAQRTAAARRTAAAQRNAAAHAAAGERRSAAARRITILDAGIRQTTARQHAAARAEAARQQTVAKTAARSQSRTTTVSSAAAVHLLSTTPGETAPSSWTGFAAAGSSLTGAVRDLSGLLSNGNRPPSFLIPIYMEAGRRYHVPWEVLAAINAIESDYGRDLNTSSAGAVGWMQFEPSTWKRYGIAADGVSEANPYDPRDAIFAAAHYLQAAGGSTDIRTAVFAYNHADWYVDEVLQRAEAISEHVQYRRAMVSRRGAVSVYFDTDLKTHPRVRYSSGTLSHYDRLIAAANMVSAADFPYLWGGGHEQPSRFGPFDCSGSVSYVMQQAGYKVGTTVAADVGGWKLPSGPGRVTIFYSATHTFMRIDGRFFGTSGFARPGGGAGWFDVDRLPAGYLAGFREVHVPHLGINSFAADAALPLGRAPLTPRARQAALERAGVDAAAEARDGVLAAQAVSDHRLIQDLVAHGLHLLRPTPRT